MKLKSCNQRKRDKEIEFTLSMSYYQLVHFVQCLEVGFAQTDAYKGTTSQLLIQLYEMMEEVDEPS